MVLFMSGMVFDAMLEPPWGWGNKCGSLKCRRRQQWSRETQRGSEKPLLTCQNDGLSMDIYAKFASISHRHENRIASDVKFDSDREQRNKKKQKQMTSNIYDAVDK